MLISTTEFRTVFTSTTAFLPPLFTPSELERGFREHIWAIFQVILQYEKILGQRLLFNIRDVDPLWCGLNLLIRSSWIWKLSTRDQFLINSSMLSDDLRTIMQCGLSPYSIIHLQIRLRGSMPNYLDMTIEFDRDDISTFNKGLSYSNSVPIQCQITWTEFDRDDTGTFDNGLSYSNLAPILIDADIRSYPGSVVSSIP